jgi:rhodanese-related sulfurtransferase
MSPIQRRTLALGLLAFGISMSATSQAQANTESVSLETARAEAGAGRAVLIDIREPDETARGVAAGAVLLPTSQLKARLAEIPVDPGKPVFLVCNSQNRSRATLKALRERGYGHVRYVEGGMSEWVRRGWPLVTPAR